MSKTAIFFGPVGGAVNRVADKIKSQIGDDKVELVPVKDATAADLERFDKIIFGISTVGKDTWNSNYSSNDWGKFLPEIEKVSYKGKKIAIFGLGDHVTYTATFVDHMAVLANKLKQNGAVLSGQVSTEGYEFDESEAVVDGKFVGLPVDEDFEPELTDERVASWVKQLAEEFGF
ncbi:MAG TPA: flavodoxin [Prolixibacteraceae bacterium]|nr:flavodoxin [Prolixibacteraceae bacterium]